MLTVYSKNNCPQCVKAIEVLKQRDIQHVVIKVDRDPDNLEWLKAQKHRSVPQFYDQGMYLGDFNSFIKPFIK